LLDVGWIVISVHRVSPKESSWVEGHTINIMDIVRGKEEKRVFN